MTSIENLDRYNKVDKDILLLKKALVDLDEDMIKSLSLDDNFTFNEIAKIYLYNLNINNYEFSESERDNLNKQVIVSGGGGSWNFNGDIEDGVMGIGSNNNLAKVLGLCDHNHGVVMYKRKITYNPSLRIDITLMSALEVEQYNTQQQEQHNVHQQENNEITTNTDH